MFQEMMIGSGGGGGGTGAYGTCTNTTGASQTVTINTGLTNIKRFYIEYNCVGTNTAAMATAQYNYDKSSTNYNAFYYNGNTTGAYYDKAIGTASGQIYTACINSISGGTVTLKTGTNSNASIKSAWWVAAE